MHNGGLDTCVIQKDVYNLEMMVGDKKKHNTNKGILVHKPK